VCLVRRPCHLYYTTVSSLGLYTEHINDDDDDDDDDDDNLTFIVTFLVAFKSRFVALYFTAAGWLD